jgi:hypothetical protein
MTQKRGRKPIPENQKKKPLIVYLSENEINSLGGKLTVTKMLQNYSQTKIKQNAKKEII